MILIKICHEGAPKNPPNSVRTSLLTLFVTVTPIVGPKQNAGSLLTPVILEIRILDLKDQERGAF